MNFSRRERRSVGPNRRSGGDGRARGGAGGAPGAARSEGASKSATKAPRAGIGDEKKRGISTFLFRRFNSIRDFVADLDNEGYSRGVWGCFPSAIGRWPAPAGYHGYKTNTPMNPEGTGHHHGLYHGIDR